MDPMGAIQPTGGQSEPMAEKPQADGGFPSIARAEQAQRTQQELREIAESGGWSQGVRAIPPAAFPDGTLIATKSSLTPGQIERVEALEHRRENPAQLSGTDERPSHREPPQVTAVISEATGHARREHQDPTRGMLDYRVGEGRRSTEKIAAGKNLDRLEEPAISVAQGSLDAKVPFGRLMSGGSRAKKRNERANALYDSRLKTGLDTTFGPDEVLGRAPFERLLEKRDKVGVVRWPRRWPNHRDEPVPHWEEIYDEVHAGSLKEPLGYSLEVARRSLQEAISSAYEEARAGAKTLFELNPERFSKMSTTEFVELFGRYIADLDELSTIEEVEIGDESAQIFQIERILAELGPGADVGEVLAELSRQADIPPMPHDQTFENFTAKVLEDKKQAVEAAKVRAQRQREYMAEKYGEDPHIERGVN